MTLATNAFEDLGYFCVDNMPLTLLPTFARLVHAPENQAGYIERAALVISFREGKFLSDFAKQLRVLRRKGLAVSVLFFEAADEILARRFSETRRPHPADRGKGLFDAIRAERTAMKRVRALADEVVVRSYSSFTAKAFAGTLQPNRRSRAIARPGPQFRAQVRTAERHGIAIRRASFAESALCGWLT